MVGTILLLMMWQACMVTSLMLGRAHTIRCSEINRALDDVVDPPRYRTASRQSGDDARGERLSPSMHISMGIRSDSSDFPKNLYHLVYHSVYPFWGTVCHWESKITRNYARGVLGREKKSFKTSRRPRRLSIAAALVARAAVQMLVQEFAFVAASYWQSAVDLFLCRLKQQHDTLH